MSRFEEQLDRFITDPQYGERATVQEPDPDKARDAEREAEEREEE